jgi:hypothetical protein
MGRYPTLVELLKFLKEYFPDYAHPGNKYTDFIIRLKLAL